MHISRRELLRWGALMGGGLLLHGCGAPWVLTVALRRRGPSPPWKKVVEPVPGRFPHHLELSAPNQIDDGRAWRHEAWKAAR